MGCPGNWFVEMTSTFVKERIEEQILLYSCKLCPRRHVGGVCAQDGGGMNVTTVTMRGKINTPRHP